MKHLSITSYLSSHWVSSHAGVALITAVVSWAIFHFSNKGILVANDHPHDFKSIGTNLAPGKTSYSDRERKNKPAPSNDKLNGRSSPESLRVNLDGSILIPAQLISRLHFYPLNPDLTPNLEELSLMGISKEGGMALEKLIQNIGIQTIDTEKKNYSIVSQDDNQVTLKIQANPSAFQNELDQVRGQLQKIAGEKSGILEASLHETISHLTAGFGSHEKIVQLTQQEDGGSTYEIMELLPESAKVLADANAPISDYRRVALQVIKLSSAKVPERLKHLFIAN